MTHYALHIFPFYQNLDILFRQKYAFPRGKRDEISVFNRVNTKVQTSVNR
ncbi:MAG: hypothetical protein QNJ63_17480 [Calothrix sp. MO_192.B10]|nr:hypothetical protein [Calothrix sp. MO_192.B10]